MTDLASELDGLDKAATAGVWRHCLLNEIATTERMVLRASREGELLISHEDAALITWLRNHTDEIKAALAAEARIVGLETDLAGQKATKQEAVQHWVRRLETAEAEHARLRAELKALIQEKRIAMARDVHPALAHGALTVGTDEIERILGRHVLINGEERDLAPAAGDDGGDHR